MSYLTIAGTDVSNLVKGLKIGYETLVSEESGRNAAGNTVLDIVNKKVKIYASFRPMNKAEMASLLNACSGFVINVSYRDSRTNSIKTVKCYTGTPEPDYYWIRGDDILYKPMDLNFIEM